MPKDRDAFDTSGQRKNKVLFFYTFNFVNRYFDRRIDWKIKIVFSIFCGRSPQQRIALAMLAVGVAALTIPKQKCKTLRIVKIKSSVTSGWPMNGRSGGIRPENRVLQSRE